MAALFGAENEVELEVVIGAGHELRVAAALSGRNQFVVRDPRVPLRCTRGYQPLLLQSKNLLAQKCHRNGFNRLLRWMRRFQTESWADERRIYSTHLEARQ
jgi:hypothetical protein